MFTEEGNGLLWILCSLIIVTLTGVFLSLLVDKRITSSHSVKGLHLKIQENNQTIERIENALSQYKKSVDSAEDEAERIQSRKSGFSAKSKQHREEIAELRLQQEALKSSIPVLEIQFANYRNEYRESAWRNATGEKIDLLYLKTGRQFENVTIRRVTSFGLEISHASGLARIDFRDLGLKYRERFQWEDQDRQRANESELPGDELESRRLPIEIKNLAMEEKSTAAEERFANLAFAQNQVRKFRAQVVSARRRHSEAVSKSRYGSARSVPGSLKTWSEQAQIREKQLSEAAGRLAVATQQLRQLSPHDPLLRADHEGLR